MTSRFLGNIFFTKEEALYLTKIRIIKKNLVHVHGFPQSLAKIEKLCQPEYFGQYGTILKSFLNQKINPQTNKKTFSAYITYSNDKEASFAILSVDSLLIEGRIIRAFFGTTKYCNYYLKNTPCPNMDKCMFLHHLVKEKDIIIEPTTIFSYNEHLELAKKIIDFYNPETKNIIHNMPIIKNTIFPNINFIFLNEIEKENYFKSNYISYIKGNCRNDNKELNLSENNNIYLIKNKASMNDNNSLVNNSKDHNGYFIKNNSIGNLNSNLIDNINITDILNSPKHKEKNTNDPLILHNIFHNTINHILSVKPFFIPLNNIPLKKMELDFLEKDLTKSGNNIYILLEGCLDCINGLQ